MSEPFPAVVETERLHLERFDAAVDVLDYYETCAADPGNEDEAPFTPWSPHDHPGETADFVEGLADAWQEGTRSGYAIFPREGESDAGVLAGGCDLVVDWDRRAGELGVWLRRKFWGRRYSAERASALLELAFDRLDLDLVGITVRVDNERSIRAVERYVDRFGGQLDGRFPNHLTADGDVYDAYRYSVDADQWSANRPEGAAVAFHQSLETAPQRPGGGRA